VNNFSVAVSPPTATVAAGIPAPFTVTVTPTGNFPETVTLSASGAPTGGQMTFPNGTSFTNLNSGPQSRQLVVNTTARVTTPASLFPIGGPFYAALFPVSGLALLGVGIGGRKSRRQRVLMAALLSCFFALVVFQLGCGSSGGEHTSPAAAPLAFRHLSQAKHIGKVVLTLPTPASRSPTWVCHSCRPVHWARNAVNIAKRTVSELGDWWWCHLAAFA
jgi:hypothetical protein